MTAIEARTHLIQLEAERALAHVTAVSGIDTYMVDLEDEIEAWRHAYVGAAVTEIASLRGELSGPQFG